MELLKQIDIINEYIEKTENIIAELSKILASKEILLAGEGSEDFMREVGRDVLIYKNMIEHKKQEELSYRKRVEKLSKEIDKDYGNK